MELNNINNLPSIDVLPLHIIEHILDYLPMYDLLCASVTCQKWFTASKHPRLRKRIKFSVVETAFPIYLLLASTRVYENINLENVELDNRDLSYFKKCGMNIKHLRLNLDQIELDYNYFVKILNCLTTLEKLEIESPSNSTDTDFCDFELNKVPMGLKNLKSLQFYGGYNPKEILVRVTRMIPNLEEFTLQEHSDIQFEQNDCFNFLTKYRQTLKYLDISNSFCGNLFANGSVTIDELDLKELRIYSCDKVVPAVQFILSQKNLTKLAIYFELTFEQIKLICDNLHKLESLEFSNDKLPSESIGKLKKLKALYLTSRDVDDLSLVDVISASRNETLKVLRFRRRNITQTLSPLFMNLPNLRELNIGLRRMEVDVFQLIFKYLVNLEVLEIDWNGVHELPKNALTNNTELYDFGRLEKLKSIEFHFPAEMIPGFSFEHLMKLKNLTTLKCRQNAPITIANQKKLMQSLPLLEDVYFGGWNVISPKVILANGPRLKRASKELLSAQSKYM